MYLGQLCQKAVLGSESRHCWTNWGVAKTNTGRVLPIAFTRSIFAPRVLVAERFRHELIVHHLIVDLKAGFQIKR